MPASGCILEHRYQVSPVVLLNAIPYSGNSVKEEKYNIMVLFRLFEMLFIFQERAVVRGLQPGRGACAHHEVAALYHL